MKQSNRLIKVFVGTESSAMLLKSRLEEGGIESLIKNDSSLAYMGNVPAVVDLYIAESDLNKAAPVIDEFTK
ncbi:MAG: DUF2007 domain-containing protein [Bacteroidetes bacterium]|nr:DUF2007 domain-containing protein [Bacteroidota bacterium]